MAVVAGQSCVRWWWQLVRGAMAAGPNGGSVRWRRLVRVIASVARPRVELWQCWPGPATASDGGVQRLGLSEPAGPGHLQRQKLQQRRTKAREARLIRAAATAAGWQADGRTDHGQAYGSTTIVIGDGMADSDSLHRT